MAHPAMRIDKILARKVTIWDEINTRNAFRIKVMPKVCKAGS
jgi:hypothetical protein